MSYGVHDSIEDIEEKSDGLSVRAYIISYSIHVQTHIETSLCMAFSRLASFSSPLAFAYHAGSTFFRTTFLGGGQKS